MPSPTVSAGSRFPAGVLALAAAVAAPAVALTADARAIDYRWKSATSGSFSDQTHWEPNGWPSQQDSARIDRTGAPYTVTGGASADTLVLDSPDLAFQLGPVAGTGGLSVRDLQLKSGLLRTAGTAEISDWSFSTPFTITNDATIHVTSGSSLTIRGKQVNSSVSPLSTFVHEPGGHLQIDGSLKLNHVAFMNHGGDFGGPARITLDGAFLSTLDGVTHSNATFVVRGWSYLRAPAGYANVNPAGQTIVLRGNSDRLFETGEMRVDHGFVNHGTIVMETDPITANDWTYLKVFNTTPTSPRLMTNLGTIVTNPGPKLDGPREIWGDLLNRPGATVTANGNFRVSGEARNEGGMSVAADRRMSFGSLTQAAGTIDVRGTLSAANFAHTGGAIDVRGILSAGNFTYTGGTITGGGTIELGGKPDQVLQWDGPDLPVPGVTFLFTDSSHVKDDIPAGYSVVLRGTAAGRDPYQAYTVGENFVNNGSLTMESEQWRYNMFLHPSRPGSSELQHFTNRGTFTIKPDTAYATRKAYVQGHMLNAAGAVTHIDEWTEVHGDLVNEGSLTIAPTRTLVAGTRPGGPSTSGFVQAGGLLDVKGILRVGNHFTYRGGTITGNAIDLSGKTLINDADEGGGQFASTSGILSLAPAAGRGAVLDGQTITVFNSQISGPFDWVNEGIVEIHYSTLTAADSAAGQADAQFRNTGEFRVGRTGHALHVQVRAKLINEPDGAVILRSSGMPFLKGVENAGTMTVEDRVTLTMTAPTFNSGTIALGPAASIRFNDDVTNTGQIVLDPTAHLDLTTSSLLHRAPDPAARDAATRHYADLIRSGRLTSSETQNDPRTGLALAPVNDTDLLIKYTYNGDANLDGLVNADDYFRIDSNFLAPPAEPTYAHGDFNYDGTINADDYFLIDSAFLAQGAPLAGSGDSSPLMSAATVPEPSALSLLVIAAAFLARCRRDRR